MLEKSPKPIPTWANAITLILLVQPSSAAAEKFFCSYGAFVAMYRDHLQEIIFLFLSCFSTI